MDTVGAAKHITQNSTPKLRKNRKIESKWGAKYYTAVKNAVFANQPSPYIPSEPPPTLSESGVGAGSQYVCKECKDSFCFQSSFEDHSTRHSWILGYSCQHCFLTICTHTSFEGSPCTVCLQLDRDKRSYLRSKGLTKSKRLGAIRVFYNQCQFFAHLKTHGLSLIDIGDIMLMPLPANKGSAWCPELYIACEALMEHAFMLQVHIIDWLKSNQVESNWWQIATNQIQVTDDPVSKVIKGYKGRVYFSTLIPSSKDLSLSSSQLHSTSNSSATSNDVETIESSKADIPDQNVIENEDNPCTLSDIAFVDCGPTSKSFEPEIPMNNVARKHSTIFVKTLNTGENPSQTFQQANITKMNNKRKRLRSLIASCNSSNVALSYGNTTITPKSNVADGNAAKDTTRKSNPIKSQIKIVPAAVAESGINKPNSNNLLRIELFQNKNNTEKSIQGIKSSVNNTGQKVFTLQTPKNVNLTSIINQLPPHLLSSKRIVLIGQDPEALSAHNKQDSVGKQTFHVLPSTSVSKNAKATQPKLVSVQLTNESKKNSIKTIRKPESEANESNDQESVFPGNVLHPNGRKYVVKRSPSLLKKSPNISTLTALMKDLQCSKQVSSDNNVRTSTSTTSDESEIPEKLSIAHADVPPLTPSPSPSELSSSSSCDIQSKHSFQSSRNVQKSDGTLSQLNFERLDTGSYAFNSSDGFETLSLRKGDAGNLYLDTKPYNQKAAQTNITGISGMITKCKREMWNEFSRLPYNELKRRYEHLQQLRDEIFSVDDIVAENVLKENHETMYTLQEILKRYINKCSEVSENCEDNVFENDWESDYEAMPDKSACPTCNKIMKPASYVPGFSKPGIGYGKYCSCYKRVCHKCLTYHGSTGGFVAHLKYHQKEAPFICPNCYRGFPSFQALELHSWTTCLHMLKRQAFGCKICEIHGFRDIESVTRHFAIMHSYNKISCDVCYMILTSHSEYKKHRKEVHASMDELQPIKLVLCKLGQCVVRHKNYMSHIEKHSTVEKLTSFKCAFCSFVAVESKKVMVHIRSKHVARLLEVVSLKTLFKILPTEVASSVLKNQPQSVSENYPMKFVNAHEEPCEDGTILPKIVNARTITSEVFERGSQEADDDPINDAGMNAVTSQTVVKHEMHSNDRLNNPDSSKAGDNSEIQATLSLPEVNKSNALPKILDVRSIADSIKTDSEIVKESSTVSTEGNINADEIRLKAEIVDTSRSDDSLSKAETESSNIGEDVADVDKSKAEETLNSLKQSEDMLLKVWTSTPKVTKTIESTKRNLKVVDSVNRTRTNTVNKSRNVGSSDAADVDKPKKEETLNSLKQPGDNRLKVWTSTPKVTKTIESTKRNLKVVASVNQTRTNIVNKSRTIGNSGKPDNQQKEASTPEGSSIAGPPPLARIPQHVFDSNNSNEIQRPDKSSNTEALVTRKKAANNSWRSQKSNRRSLQRIALNSPITGKESDHNFSCHLCGELISTSWSVLSTHYKNKHSHDHKLSIVTPKLLRISPEFIRGGYKDLFAGRKRKSDSIPSNAKRRRRWTPKKYSEAKNTSPTDLGLYVEQETVQDDEGNFKCKKCNQRCSDMADLREHIAATHRIKGRYLICLECGENFVVVPSLQMHLKAFHGIADPITYMAQNTSYAPDNVDDLQMEGKTTVANQCHVCMAVFEDKAAVDKHLRVHGMAFLNRKRIEARNALKSPVKGKPDEAKSSPVKEKPKEIVKREKPAETILEKISATL